MGSECFPCPSCSKVFLEEQSLRVHSSQIHDDRLNQGGIEPRSIR